MQNNQVAARINPESADFVPDAADVVSPTVLAEVFGGAPVPFATNADGSATRIAYLSHLEAVWELGMAEAEAEERTTDELAYKVPAMALLTAAGGNSKML